jgi:hypothetical protein
MAGKVALENVGEKKKQNEITINENYIFREKFRG